MTDVKELQGLIEADISRLHFGEQPRSLYDPIHYILSIGGKRLRPMLTLLSYGLYRHDVAKVVRFATAVEAFHNFTLMHDDIMDRAPLRRGKKTVHEKWDMPTAILSGDVMLVQVYEMLRGVPADKMDRVLQLFNVCATGVCEGQQWDMEFERKSRVSEREYIEMIRLKTAVLLGFALELGAVLAGASAEDQKILRKAGEHLGVGFQLKDDLLDVYGDRKKFGKQIGGDIISNKKTFLLIYALQRARGKDRLELQRWLSAKRFDKRKKVKAVTALYNSLGVREAAEAQVEKYFQMGFTALEELQSGKGAGVLGNFARQLVSRQS